MLSLPQFPVVNRDTFRMTTSQLSRPKATSKPPITKHGVVLSGFFQGLTLCFDHMASNKNFSPSMRELVSSSMNQMKPEVIFALSYS